MGTCPHRTGRVEFGSPSCCRRCRSGSTSRVMFENHWRAADMLLRFAHLQRATRDARPDGLAPPHLANLDRHETLSTSVFRSLRGSSGCRVSHDVPRRWAGCPSSCRRERACPADLGERRRRKAQPGSVPTTGTGRSPSDCGGQDEQPASGSLGSSWGGGFDRFRSLRHLESSKGSRLEVDEELAASA